MYEIGGEQSHFYKMRHQFITRKRGKGNVKGVRVACFVLRDSIISLEEIFVCKKLEGHKKKSKRKKKNRKKNLADPGWKIETKKLLTFFLAGMIYVQRGWFSNHD